MIWQFLRDLTTKTINMPITVHFSHHERTATGPSGGIDKAGGTGIEFLATIDLRFRLGQLKAAEEEYTARSPEFTQKVRNSPIPIQGKHINIRCRKNSNAPDVDKQIYVPLRWTWKPDETSPNGWRQITCWDWETSTADMLFRQERFLTGTLDIRRNTSTAGANQRYYSDALGIPEKTKGVPSDEFGKMVTSDPELFAKIERALHIQKQIEFHPELLEVEKLKKKTAKKAAPKKASTKKATKKKAPAKKAAKKKAPAKAPPTGPATEPPAVPPAPPPPPTVPAPPPPEGSGSE